MSDSAKSSTESVIIFEFDGGAFDGQAIRSDQPQHDANEARTLWALTRKGLIGRRFDMPLPNSPSICHRYKIMGKCEMGQEVRVECRYVGEENRPAAQFP